MHDGSIQQLDSNSVQISHQQQDHARQINAASMQQQRASLSPEQQDHPCLKLYIGAHVMVNNNDLLKSHGIGNGSMGSVKRVQLKSTATNPEWKNWEGKKVYCVSVNDVEYIEIERFPESSKMKSRCLELILMTILSRILQLMLLLPTSTVM